MPRVPNTIMTNANQISRIATKPPAYPIDYHGDLAELTSSRLALQSTVSARSEGIDPGNIITDVTFTAGTDQIVQHKLQRAYKGFIVRRPRGTHPISIIEVPQNNPLLDKVQITINANTNCIIDLEVY